MTAAPAVLTSFVGREHELGEVRGLLAQRRLLTLTGGGGCGKTRLAHQVLQRPASEPVPPVVAVDVGELGDEDQVGGAVAAAAGISLEPGTTGAATLAAALAERRLLLWLDTCEHVLDAAAELVDAVLARCPGISVLATSRVPLGLAGETVWRVPSLRPDDAAALFRDRAGLVAPERADDLDAEEVDRICSRLDNLPLAIELAAPWVRVLSLRQIRDGLAGAIDLLAASGRSLPRRHRTLLASMSWSTDLLTDDERSQFLRLGVFHGPFTVDAAAAVLGRPLPEARQLVARLVDCSLVVTVDLHHQMHYRLLDTVRQFARDRLEESGELDAVRARHLDFFLGLAVAAEDGIAADQERWRLDLAGAWPDLAAASDWAWSRGDLADHGRRLAVALARPRLLTGSVGRGLSDLARATRDGDPQDPAGMSEVHASRALLAMAAGRLEEVAAEARAARDGDPDSRTRATCLMAEAFHAFFLDFAECAELASAARREARAGRDEFMDDWAAVLHAYSLVTRGRGDEADALVRAVRDRARQRRDRFCGAFAEGVRIHTHLARGRVAEAVAAGRRALELVAPLGEYFARGTLTGNTAYALVVAGEAPAALELLEPMGQALSHADGSDPVGLVVPWGMTRLWLGDVEEALQWFQRGLSRGEDSRDWTAARCLPGYVAALRLAGRAEEAERWAVRGHRLLASYGAPVELAELLDEHGMLVRAEPARARELHLQALVVRRDHGVRLGAATSLDGLAEAAAALQDAPTATRLAAAADELRASMGAPRPPYETGRREALVAALRSELGDDFDAVWAEGSGEHAETVLATLVRGRGPRATGSDVHELLTPTEVEVCRLVADGLSNPQIAERLYMSRGTVKAHLSHVFTKLGVRNRTALATVLKDSFWQD